MAAEALAGKALGIVRRSRMENYPPNALAYAVAARVAAHRGEAKRATELLTSAQPLRPQLTHVVAVLAIQTRLELAKAYLALADVAGARTVLREAEELLRRGSDFGAFKDGATALRSALESARVNAPGASTLTGAELRVLPYLATHLSSREIGERLYVTHHTVKSHVKSIYRKLDVTSRGQAVERATELGLI